MGALKVADPMTEVTNQMQENTAGTCCLFCPKPCVCASTRDSLLQGQPQLQTGGVCTCESSRCRGL